MMRTVFALLSALILASCGGPRYTDYFPRHDDGTLKPHVVFLPVRSNCQIDLPWDTSAEITQGVRNEIMNNGDLFFFSPQKIQRDMEACGDVDYFGQDLSFTQCFCGADFLVISELIEHRYCPYEKGKYKPIYQVQCACSKVLAMKLRVRIIDLRRDKPRIVLQEIFTSNHMLPVYTDSTDYSTCGYGTKGYSSTQIGMAHYRLSRDFANRIETITQNER